VAEYKGSRVRCILNSIILFIGEKDGENERDFHEQYFIVLYYIIAQTMILEFPLPRYNRFAERRDVGGGGGGGGG